MLQSSFMFVLWAALIFIIGASKTRNLPGARPTIYLHSTFYECLTNHISGYLWAFAIKSELKNTSWTLNCWTRLTILLYWMLNWVLMKFRLKIVIFICYFILTMYPSVHLFHPKWCQVPPEWENSECVQNCYLQILSCQENIKRCYLLGCRYFNMIQFQDYNRYGVGQFCKD